MQCFLKGCFRPLLSPPSPVLKPLGLAERSGPCGGGGLAEPHGVSLQRAAVQAGTGGLELQWSEGGPAVGDYALGE